MSVDKRKHHIFDFFLQNLSGGNYEVRGMEFLPPFMQKHKGEARITIRS